MSSSPILFPEHLEVGSILSFSFISFVFFCHLLCSSLLFVSSSNIFQSIVLPVYLLFSFVIYWVGLSFHRLFSSCSNWNSFQSFVLVCLLNLSISSSPNILFRRQSEGRLMLCFSSPSPIFVHRFPSLPSSAPRPPRVCLPQRPLLARS